MKKFYCFPLLLLFILGAHMSSAQVANLVITEIMYNPPESGTDSTEFIEIFNAGSTAVNLQGYSFTSGVVYTFPNVTLPANGIIVVAVDSVAMNNVFGAFTYQWTSGGLSNGGEPISLRDNLNQLVDSLRYDDVAPWPTTPDGSGPSLELINPSLDNSIGSNWQASTSNTGIIVNGSTLMASPGQLPILVNISSTNVSCNGGSDGTATATTTSGSAPFTYLWNTGAVTATIVGLSANTYTVTVTDNNGSTASSSTTITEPAALIASALVDSNVTCNGLSDGGATASPSGGTMPYTYVWSLGATTASITGVAAGTYTITITDNNGCTAFSSAQITQPSVINASLTPTNVSCNGSSDGSINAIGSGGTAPYTYSWSNGSTTMNNTNLAPGTYTVTITDNNGCTSSNSTSITQPSVISNNISKTDISCNGLNDGTATVNSSGGTTPYTFLWSTGSTSSTISNLSAGSYTVTVVDANGCTSSTANISITQPTAVSATASSSNVLCNGGNTGSVNLTAGGGNPPYSYSWSNGATTANLSNVAAGTYTVTITDNNGCTTISSSTITEPAPIVISLNIISVSCNGANDGSINANASGGTSPITYNWSTGSNQANQSNLMAGTYTVTITDANGCTNVSNAIVTQPAPITSTISTVNASCNGSGDGSASITVSGGTPPYFYTWTGNQSTPTAINLFAGTYSVTIVDANACTHISSATITQPAPINTTVSQTGVNINANLSGASYQWLDCNNNFAVIAGATMQSYTATVNGDYAVEITQGACKDTSSCVSIISLGIEEQGNGLEFTLFPNPNNGKFTIQINKDNISNEILNIYDLSGKLVYREIVRSSQVQVNLDYLSDGLYFIDLGGLKKKIILRH